MTSTFTLNKALELMGTGDHVDTWGAELNTGVFTLVDQCLGSPTTIALSNAPVTLTTTQTQNLSLLFTGTLTANVTVTIPAVGGIFFLQNGTTGPFTLTIASAGAGTSQVLPINYGAVFITDGTNIYNLTQPEGAFTSIAGAATVDLGTVPNGLINITGSGVSITSFGASARSVQPLFIVQFSASNTIVNSSAIVCPGGTNIIAQANDTFLVMNTGSGNYRIIGSFLASGLPLVGATGINAPAMQTALTGPKDTNGIPNFLPATSGTLTISSSGLTTVPLIVTVPSGYNSAGLITSIQSIAVNQTWTAVSNTTTYLAWNLATQSAFSTTIPPIYQRGGALSVTAGQYTFDIVGAQMWLGNGTAVNQASVVFLGEAVAGASSIVSTVCYAYQGISESGFTQTLPAASTALIFNHNLGVLPKQVDVFIQCISANATYNVGDVIQPSTGAFQDNAKPQPAILLGRNTARIIGNSTDSVPWWATQGTGGGTQQALTVTDWAANCVARRGW